MCCDLSGVGLLRQLGGESEALVQQRVTHGVADSRHELYDVEWFTGPMLRGGSDRNRLGDGTVHRSGIFVCYPGAASRHFRRVDSSPSPPVPTQLHDGSDLIAVLAVSMRPALIRVFIPLAVVALEIARDALAATPDQTSRCGSRRCP